MCYWDYWVVSLIVVVVETFLQHTVDVVGVETILQQTAVVAIICSLTKGWMFF